MIAHRGLSGLALENTMPAFELAGQRSYYGIETDVHVTRDGKYILTHDDDLRRIVGLDLIVEETDYETLRALRFKDIYGKSDEENCCFPSLEEYILLCKRYNKQAVLELKNEMSPKDVLGIAATIDACGWLGKTTFISFSGENLLFLRKGYPTASAQYLLSEVTDKDFAFLVENKLDVDLQWTCVRKRLVKRLQVTLRMRLQSRIKYTQKQNTQKP